MIVQDKTNVGFYITDNTLVDVYLRIIGQGSFAAYCLIKRMCKGSAEEAFPNVSQKDWAQRLGVSEKTFRAYLDTLEEAGLLEISEPKNPSRPFKYILLPIPEDIEHIPAHMIPDPLKDCRFLDPIYQSAEKIFHVREKLPHDVREKLPDYKRTVGSNTVLKKNKTKRKRDRFIPDKKIYSKLSKRLRDIITSHIKVSVTSNLRGWPAVFRALHEKDGVPLARIGTVMDWYEDNIGRQYTPECFSAITFREKFVKLEAAMVRKKPNGDGRPKAPIAIDTKYSKGIEV